MKLNLFNKFFKTENPSVAANIDTTNFATNDDEFKFVLNDPSTIDTKGQVISFGDLTRSNLNDTLSIYRNGQLFIKLDLRYNYSSSNKKEVVKFDRFVAIGLSGFFYLYDLSSESVILFIDLGGYFDGFKIYDQGLLVAYNSGIYCLTSFGTIKWHNSNIGLDGIIINSVKEGKIYGDEQIDPPDGWKDFVLDIETGKRIE